MQHHNQKTLILRLPPALIVLQVQYCDAASEVCCRLPATPNKPSGCAGYGPGGSCDVTPAPVTPFQPGLVHVTPAPSQPGLVHVPPTPSQPGLVHVPPAPSQPGLVHIPPSPKPSFPVSGGQYPSPSIPSPTYAPANNFGKPIPGTNGVPIGGSIYDVTRHPVTPAPNPSPYTGPLNTTPYPGCAAALKCVPETYCTADGVMADKPVVLTREQYENRVPLSVSTTKQHILSCNCSSLVLTEFTVNICWFGIT